MSNQSDHTIVRLRVPPELKKQIEEAAEHNNRSQSAEMVARLEDSFKQIKGDSENIEVLTLLLHEQKGQINQLQEMIKQLVIRPRQMHE